MKAPEEIAAYKLESESVGRPISCGSNSMPLSPALLIRVLSITGSSINCLTLFIDHVLALVMGLSWKISVLSCLSEGHLSLIHI